MEHVSKECVLFLGENAVCRRAEHVLVLICWQIVGKQKFSANTHGTKIFREIAENNKKAKNSCTLKRKCRNPWCRQPESNRHGFNSGGF